MSTEKTVENVDTVTLPPKAIPLNDAIAYSVNWRTIAEQNLMPDNYIKAFKIPILDFKEIMHENAVGIRAYIGDTINNEKKLLIVGLDANDNDMIDYANGQFVFDFTTPCPNMCDQNSPLNG